MSDPAKAAQGPADKNRADKNRAPAPASTDQAVIRNFCIIAHIDHGKSTLADRMLQLTGIVDARQMRAQYLDRMDIERERGITIKSQAVRLPWKKDGTHYVLNMIDTPGHVDFTYEVQRSLEACEGAVLLVDAAQGIEAQTLANLYLAINADLKIIPVLNKIDLPAAQPERYAEELSAIIGCDPSEVLKVSAKTGEGVEELLNTIVDQVPHPHGRPGCPGPGADLRLRLRHLPRRRHLRAGGRRQVHQARAHADDVHPERPRDPGTRRHLPGAHPVRRPRRGRGRLRHLRREGRPPGPRRRHDHHLDRRGERAAGGLRPPQADGLLRPLPGRRRRVPGAARRPGQAPAQRRGPGLRAGDVAPRSASASAAASSACCTWRSSGSGWSASST